MDIFVHTRFASFSEFKSDSNALIFSLIGRELSELCEFYKMYPEMEIFHAVRPVPFGTANICKRVFLKAIGDVQAYLQVPLSALSCNDKGPMCQGTQQQ